MSDAEAIMALRRISREQAEATKEYEALMPAILEASESRDTVSIMVRDHCMGYVRTKAPKPDAVCVWHLDGLWHAGNPLYKGDKEQGYQSFADAVEAALPEAEKHIAQIRAEARKIKRLLDAMGEP